MTTPIFNSKLLLFGEYTIIDNGGALAIPFNKYAGKWAVSGEKSELNGFFKHLETLKGCLKDKTQEAIEKNWIFESNIPQGYGLGSSGALTAAAFDAFFIKDRSNRKLVRQKLAEIESYFHGNSSGLDPLTSYYNNPILIHETSIKTISNLDLSSPFFLLDSKIERDSKSLIKWFKNEKENVSEFREALIQLNNYNNLAINSILCSNLAGVTQAMSKISELQFSHFKKMIPSSIAQIWKTGLDTGDYFLKLAGAGGGGFFLGLGDFENIAADCFKL